MTEWFEQIVFWHWWILAGLLLIVELTAPAFFFLWLGIAAAATGLLLLVFPAIPLEMQLVLFAHFPSWRSSRGADIANPTLLFRISPTSTGAVNSTRGGCLPLDSPLKMASARSPLMTQPGALRGRIYPPEHGFASRA